MTTDVQVIYPLYPLNDLTLLVTLKTVSTPDGKVTLLSAGTVTGFLALSDSPTAIAADQSLAATVVYTGAGGKWLVTIDAALLTANLLASLFANAAPYLILQLTGGFRVAIQLAYFASRPAVQT